MKGSRAGSAGRVRAVVVRTAVVVVLLGGSPGLTACADWFLAPEPGDDPVALFDAVWREYDLYYSHFGLKGIDWDSVYAVYRPRVGPGMSPGSLADVIGEMVVGLEDGHADLYAGQRRYGYAGYYQDRPENWVPGAIDRIVYTAPPSERPPRGTNQAPGVSYAWVTDRIGYVRIPGFGTSEVREGIDEALAALSGTEALVIDIRHNGGGSDLNSDAVVGRFLERRLLVQYHAYRNGPDHDDFTDPVADYVEPRGAAPYAGPIALLTNRRVFSTAESFVLAIRALGERRYTVTVGDTTGGGFGNPVWRELPNGWTFRVPRWLVWSPAMEQFEGVGVPPDISAEITPLDADMGQDPILTAARSALEDRLDG